jgi:murein endopeptidase
MAVLVAAAAGSVALGVSGGADRQLVSPAPAPPPVDHAAALEEPISLAGPGSTEAGAQAPAADAPAVSSPSQKRKQPTIAWHHSRAVGVPHNGRLVNGVGLPVAGPDWVTWDPARNRTPNRADRLFGTDALVRRLLGVLGDYRAAHPNAPRVVIGDLSLRRGGEIDEHVSHENGLDVDVYYPRLDGHLRPPATVSQIDHRLAQDLLRRFVAAGVQVVFVGPSTGLRGPRGVVAPYPNHDNHMHVRIPAPA